MFTHEASTTLLDSTMDLLEGDQSSTTSKNGAGIIDQWLAQLNQAENAKDIASTLEQVKVQLENGATDPSELAQLLETLATQTTEFSTMLGPEGDLAYRLDGLASALKSLSGQIGNQQ